MKPTHMRASLTYLKVGDAVRCCRDLRPLGPLSPAEPQIKLHIRERASLTLPMNRTSAAQRLKLTIQRPLTTSCLANTPVRGWQQTCWSAGSKQSRCWFWDRRSTRQWRRTWRSVWRLSKQGVLCLRILLASVVHVVFKGTADE
jgi:hypothetical protein